MRKYCGIVIGVISLVSCRTTAPNSSTTDIGVLNTQDATAKVVYEDQGKVYLKNCNPPLAPPLTRNCATDETPKDLDIGVYLSKLPFEVGAFQRNAQGLALVTKALQDANDAVAAGNQNAMSTVQRLTLIKQNLEKILALQYNLQANQNGLTYYEYHEEFSKLLVPFGESVGSSTSVPGMNFIPVPGQGFSMQETEVTRGQWNALMGYYPEENDSSCITYLNGPSDDYPASCVSAKDAERFADEMTKKKDGHTYRLPSEQEWATAAGNIEGSVYGWCKSMSTQPVKRFRVHNGLYDMVGNVSEWTSTTWSSSSDSGHVSRGRGILESQCGTSIREEWKMDARYFRVGFRLLREP